VLTFLCYYCDIFALYSLEFDGQLTISCEIAKPMGVPVTRPDYPKPANDANFAGPI